MFGYTMRTICTNQAIIIIIIIIIIIFPLTSGDWGPPKSVFFQVFKFFISLLGEIWPVENKLVPTRYQQGVFFFNFAM